MHLNCCDWAGVISFTIQILSNFFVYFSPCICSDRRNLGWSRKTLLMFHEGSTWLHPVEHSPWRCALHLLLPSQAEHTTPGSGTGHVLSASWELGNQRWGSIAGDLWFLMHLLAHTVLQETEHFLCPTRWFDYNTQSLLPAFLLFHANSTVTCPLGVQENTSHIFPHHCSCVVTLSPGLSELVAARSPFQVTREHLWTAFSGLLSKGRALALVVVTVSTLFCTESSDCYSEEY